MSEQQLILVTGATGKVGHTFIQRILSDPDMDTAVVRALCHSRQLPPQDRLEVVTGSIEDQEVVSEAVEGATHVLHLATVKETPEKIMDVAIKGLFWLLEECRQSQTFRQFLMVGADAAMGHFFYDWAAPVTEDTPLAAYPGCYALSKVLEQVMLEQYFVQYNLNGCCFRPPWIMEKDDLKYSLSFGEDVFGGPRWRELVGAEKADEYQLTQAVPVMLDAHGGPMKRNIVHVNDLVEAIVAAIDNPNAEQEVLNISMDEPFDYGLVAEYLTQTRGYHPVEIPSEFYSTWLDNSKAKFLLDWRPAYDYKRLVDESFDYQRSPDDPRKVWYPG
jgi:nucleoside-diphosphate-sugar epimerase